MTNAQIGQDIRVFGEFNPTSVILAPRFVQLNVYIIFIDTSHGILSEYKAVLINS